MHRVSVTLCVVPSSTWLPSKGCPGIAFLSSADREIGVFRRVALPTRLLLEFPHETGLILRYAWKFGNPFQTNEGNRLTCHDQDVRRSSDEVVPGTSVYPWNETGMSGNFWGRIKGAKFGFTLLDGTWEFS